MTMIDPDDISEITGIDTFTWYIELLLAFCSVFWKRLRFQLN